jgi:hypothetical protein
MYCLCVYSIAVDKYMNINIYGAETWSLYEDDRRRITATERDELRRSARISKLDRKTNEYITEKNENARYDIG